MNYSGLTTLICRHQNIFLCACVPFVLWKETFQNASVTEYAFRVAVMPPGSHTMSVFLPWLPNLALLSSSMP